MRTQTTLHLLPTEGNPRNSEGSFAKLTDGRLLYVYSHYSGRSWNDDATADLTARVSNDQGKTWGEDQMLLAHDKDALNLMSPSLLRLRDGRLSLTYLRKSASAEHGVDCIPWMRFSSDDGRNWSEPSPIVAVKEYYVANNDRVIQLPSGRIIVPNSFHRAIDSTLHDGRAIGLFFLSDDGGKSFRESADWVLPLQHCGSGLQEPGVVSLGGDKLMAYFRTDLGFQYKAFSEDGGEHWTDASPSGFIAPCSPLSIKRRPSTGELFAVWNDRSNRWPDLPAPKDSSWSRTPLVLARSDDNGKTWKDYQLLENDPARGYCYTAMHFTDDNALLLAYCCGGTGNVVLAESKIVRIELD